VNARTLTGMDPDLIDAPTEATLVGKSQASVSRARRNPAHPGWATRMLLDVTMGRTVDGITLTGLRKARLLDVDDQLTAGGRALLDKQTIRVGRDRYALASRTAVVRFWATRGAGTVASRNARIVSLARDGLSQRQIAEHLGVSQTTVRRVLQDAAAIPDGWDARQWTALQTVHDGGPVSEVMRQVLRSRDVIDSGGQVTDTGRALLTTHATTEEASHG